MTGCPLNICTPEPDASGSVVSRRGSPSPTVKIGMPRFFATAAPSSALLRRSPPSETRMIALWSSIVGSSACSAVRIAAPRSVSPRGADSGVAVSSAERRNARSVVSGHSRTPFWRNATSAHLSPSSESTRSAISAFARSRRLGRTSAASMERLTSRATTTFRLFAATTCVLCPHCGRAAANRQSARPERRSIACTTNVFGLFGSKRPWRAGATKPLRRASERARRNVQNAPATGTSSTSTSIHGFTNRITQASLTLPSEATPPPAQATHRQKGTAENTRGNAGTPYGRAWSFQAGRSHLERL